MIGMYIHWSIVLFGMVLPFIPMISIVLSRRAERRRNNRDEANS
jgi:hypothetical protein